MYNMVVGLRNTSTTTKYASNGETVQIPLKYKVMEATMLDWYAINYRENREKGHKAMEALIKEWSDLKEYATIEEVQQACFRLMGALSKIPHFLVSFQFEEFRIFATVSTYDAHGTGNEEFEGTVVIDVYHGDSHGYWIEPEWKRNDKK